LHVVTHIKIQETKQEYIMNAQDQFDKYGLAIMAVCLSFRIVAGVVAATTTRWLSWKDARAAKEEAAIKMTDQLERVRRIERR
jgi:hypothetical protein